MAATAISTLPFPITLLVSDSTDMGCELLCSALTSDEKPGLRVIASTVSCHELVAAAVANRPDLALVSLALQDGPTAGLLVLRELRAQTPATRCVLLMDRPNPGAIIEAFRCGARGVFQRSSSFRMLRHCIHVVHEGQIWVSSSELSHLLEVFATAIPLSFNNASGQELLSKREKEIVMLVMQGLTNREIAQQATLSEHTVKNYLLRVFDKLGVSNRAELIIYALQRQSQL
jgi:DNA-binding NarL/FixJ family response regulator